MGEPDRVIRLEGDDFFAKLLDFLRTLATGSSEHHHVAMPKHVAHPRAKGAR